MSTSLSLCWLGTRVSYDEFGEVPVEPSVQHSPLDWNIRISSECCTVNFCGDLCDLVEYETFLQATEALCVNDCKSLADALLAAGSAASKTSEDKRLRIELSMIKQRLSRNERGFQWVEGTTMPADVLAKGKERGHVELPRKLKHTAWYQIRGYPKITAIP